MNLYDESRLYARFGLIFTILALAIGLGIGAVLKCHYTDDKISALTAQIEKLEKPKQ